MTHYDDPEPVQLAMTHYDDPELVQLATRAITRARTGGEPDPSSEDIASAVLDAVVPCIAKKVVCEIAEARLPRNMSMRDFLLLQAEAFEVHSQDQRPSSTTHRFSRRSARVGSSDG